ncbi:anti-sigma factor [Enterobacteriaceae bacterium RIT691]|nr:anti-sigma factor [Enterobacteriaceae bacterium RIT691]
MNIQDQDPLLAAEYVLGLTDSLTRQSLDKRLADDEDFARQVAGWQKAFSSVDQLTSEVTPASAVWKGIERELSGAGPQAVSPTRLRPTAWLGWALAAAMAGLLIFNYANKPQTVPTLQPIAVLSGTQSGEQFIVSLNTSASVIQVSALNVTLPQANNLQLWLIKGTSPPRSLGLITHRDLNQFPLAAEQLDKQTVLAISLEPVGGSKLAGPSGPVLYQGKVSPL